MLVALADHKMIKKVQHSNIDILESRYGHQNAILYFHGFPGPYQPLSEGETKVVDHIFEEIKDSVDFYYPLYTLKKTGPFTFIESFRDAENVLNYLTDKHSYKRVYLIAQSWGTVVSMPLTQVTSFKKIILITPYFVVPQGEVGANVVKKYSQLYPQLLRSHLQEQLIEEFEYIAQNKSPMKFLLPSLTNKTVIASEMDEIVSLDSIKHCTQKMKNTKLIVLPNQSHIIKNKNHVGTIILNEIK